MSGVHGGMGCYQVKYKAGPLPRMDGAGLVRTLSEKEVCLIEGVAGVHKTYRQREHSTFHFRAISTLT